MRTVSTSRLRTHADALWRLLYIRLQFRIAQQHRVHLTSGRGTLDFFSLCAGD